MHITCCFSIRNSKVLMPLKQSQDSNGASTLPSVICSAYIVFPKLVEYQKIKYELGKIKRKWKLAFL